MVAGVSSIDYRLMFDVIASVSYISSPIGTQWAAESITYR
jgi:hypothetical protein